MYHSRCCWLIYAGKKAIFFLVFIIIIPLIEKIITLTVKSQLIYSDFPLFLLYFSLFFLISLHFLHYYIFIYRSRLSLDLSSPTSTNQLGKHFSIQFHNDPQKKSNTFYKSPTFSGTGYNNINKRVIKSKSNNNIIISPRYTEFKTFNSAFDGLQALEKSNNNNNINNCSINNSNNNINNNISATGDNISSGVVANNSLAATSTTTSIMINCGGVATSPASSMTSNSNISTVLLNSALSDGMAPLSRSASLPIKAPSLSSGNYNFSLNFSLFFVVRIVERYSTKL